MTSFRLSTAALCAVGLLLCLAFPVASVYATGVPGAKAPMTLSEAEGVLRNTSFYDRWSPEGALDSPKTAERVHEEGETHLSTVEKAVNIVRSACYERFFVNSCIEDARKLSFLRQREIRSVMLAADEMVRLDRAARAREGKGKDPTPIQLQHRRAAESSPSDMKPATQKAPSAPVGTHQAKPKAPAEPMNIRPAKVKTPSASTDIKPAEVKEPGVPERIPGAKNESNVTKDREAMEAANEAWYAEKQREAAERERQTQERIEKNRRDREAKQADLKRSTEERQAAQKRYEEHQQNRESGLAKYF